MTILERQPNRFNDAGGVRLKYDWELKKRQYSGKNNRKLWFQ